MKIYKFTEFLNEKVSSLTKLGIPNEVMKQIQIDFELEPHAEWTEIMSKEEFKEQIKNKGLYLEVGGGLIKVFAKLNTYYMMDTYIAMDGEWETEWIKKDREKIQTITQLYKNLSFRNTRTYVLKGDEYQVELKKQRKIKTVSKDFDKFNKDFKIELLSKFNNIIENQFKINKTAIINKIVSNMEDVGKGTLTSGELLEILKKGNELASEIKRKEKEKEEKSLIVRKLETETIKDNSLSIFDEYLMMFEDACSTEEYMNIKDIVEKYGREKTMRAFIYFIYSGKVIL